MSLPLCLSSVRLCVCACVLCVCVSCVCLYQGLEPVFTKVLTERRPAQHIVVVLRDNLRSAFAPHFALAAHDIVELDLRG